MDSEPKLINNSESLESARNSLSSPSDSVRAKPVYSTVTRKEKVTSMSPVPMFRHNSSKINMVPVSETKRQPVKREDHVFNEEWLIHRNKTRLTEDDIAALAQNINYKKLLCIDFSNDNLRKFPMGIMKYTKQLKHISIANNKISALPNDLLIWFPQIELLDLSNNHLVVLQSPVFGNFKNFLKTLNLAQNRITSLPSTLKFLYSLTHLHINGNAFVEIPCSLKELNKLECLYLSWIDCLNLPNSSEKLTKDSEVSLMSLFEFLKGLKKKTCHFLEFFKRFSVSSVPPDQMKKDFFGRNLLHQAVFQGDVGAFRALAEAYPSLLEKKDNEECTAVAFALRMKQGKFLPVFVELGVGLNITAGRFGSLVHIATNNLSKKTCQTLLNAGASADLTDSQGNTPLHILFQIYSKNRQKSQAIMKILMEKASSCLNTKNNKGLTPLQQLVVQNTSTGFMLCFMHNKSDSAAKNGRFDFKVLDKNENTLLHLAALHPNIQIMVHAISEFPEACLMENDSKKTPYDLIPFDFLTSKKISLKGTKNSTLKGFLESRKERKSDLFFFTRGGIRRLSPTTSQKKKPDQPRVAPLGTGHPIPILTSWDFDPNSICELKAKDLRNFNMLDPEMESKMEESFRVAQAGIEKFSRVRDQISKRILEELGNDFLSSSQKSEISILLMEMTWCFFAKHFYLNKLNVELMKYSIPLALFSEELFEVLLEEKLLERDLDLYNSICGILQDKNTDFSNYPALLFQIWFMKQASLFGFHPPSKSKEANGRDGKSQKQVFCKRDQKEFQSMPCNSSKSFIKPEPTRKTPWSELGFWMKMNQAEFLMLEMTKGHFLFKFPALNKYISKSQAYSKRKKMAQFGFGSCFNLEELERAKKHHGSFLTGNTLPCSGFLGSQTQNERGSEEKARKIQQPLLLS